MSRYKKLTWVLLSLNIIALGIGFYLRYEKLSAENLKRQESSKKLVQTFSQVGLLPYEEANKAQNISQDTLRSRSISDADLDTLLKAINKSLQTGKRFTLVEIFGFSLMALNDPPEHQKQRIGETFLHAANVTQDDETRLFCLMLIYKLNIRSTLPDIAPFTQSKNAKVKKIATVIIQKWSTRN